MKNNNAFTFPRWIWVIYGILFVISIPWYLRKEIGMYLIMGLPLWLLLSIGAIFFTAAFTAWVIARYWH